MVVPVDGVFVNYLRVAAGVAKPEATPSKSFEESRLSETTNVGTSLTYSGGKSSIPSAPKSYSIPNTFVRSFDAAVGSSKSAAASSRA